MTKSKCRNCGHDIKTSDIGKDTRWWHHCYEFAPEKYEISRKCNFCLCKNPEPGNLCEMCIWRYKSREASQKGGIDVAPRAECKRHEGYGHKVENRGYCDDFHEQIEIITPRKRK